MCANTDNLLNNARVSFEFFIWISEFVLQNLTESKRPIVRTNRLIKFD